MKLIIKFLVVVWACAANAQSHPSAVSVQFVDGHVYMGKVITKDEHTVKVQFLQSGSIYVFDDDGNIISSTGLYKAGAKVSYISIFDFDEDVYTQTALEEGNLVGVVFGDGQLYFGTVLKTEGNASSIIFVHSGSLYSIQYADGQWKVVYTDKGRYPVGHILKDIYYVSPSPENFFPKQQQAQPIDATKFNHNAN